MKEEQERIYRAALEEARSIYSRQIDQAHRINKSAGKNLRLILVLLSILFGGTTFLIKSGEFAGISALLNDFTVLGFAAMIVGVLVSIYPYYHKQRAYDSHFLSKILESEGEGFDLEAYYLDRIKVLRDAIKNDEYYLYWQSLLLSVSQILFVIAFSLLLVGIYVAAAS